MNYFLTPLYLKQVTAVGESVDDVVLAPFIKVAADSYVRSILGTYFYNDLLVKYNAQTLSGDEITLVEDYIKDAVAWRACAEAVFATSYQIRNKGVITQSGDFTQPADARTVSTLQHHYRQIAENLEGRLLKYLSLSTNRALFPALTNVLNTDSMARCQDCGGSNTYGSDIIFI
jgi:hypothetical protein